MSPFLEPTSPFSFLRRIFFVDTFRRPLACADHHPKGKITFLCESSGAKKSSLWKVYYNLIFIEFACASSPSISARRMISWASRLKAFSE